MVQLVDSICGLCSNGFSIDTHFRRSAILHYPTVEAQICTHSMSEDFDHVMCHLSDILTEVVLGNETYLVNMIK